MDTETEPRLAFIEWLDAYCLTGWREVKDIDSEPLTCRTVGWIVKENEDCLVVAPHLSSEDHAEAPLQGNGVLTIPARSILRTVTLQLPATA